ncbi:hypothetical protein BO70DRAFT_382206 [Aspergillus heteromorphus CBS 117.55]|uniref:EthD domain-containing protein n=1 Tax=Aspergillus heteromorphus CBS 117.55 TaxID=1448321 RepID=A0A317VDP4_9EURO|nr:uncharacterized protein BO70DRAFT_382206 [Aspergillus heteromorphus CBS 117.55]PWY71022.1 hypothetical protein BO70DRAFT_382206 [Aspergillus heteromorphus CBS 117.55]
MTNSTAAPGRLLRLTLQIYRNQLESTEAEREKFAREYLTKAASMAAKHGIEKYQQVYTPPAFREALEEVSRRGKRGWVIDDHDLTVEFYFRSFAAMGSIGADPEWRALQASEGPYVNLIHTVATFGWVEQYVDAGKVIHIGEDGKSTYPSWAELGDVKSAFPAPAAAPAAATAEGDAK